MTICPSLNATRISWPSTARLHRDDVARRHRTQRIEVDVDAAFLRCGRDDGQRTRRGIARTAARCGASAAGAELHQKYQAPRENRDQNDRRQPRPAPASRRDGGGSGAAWARPGAGGACSLSLCSSSGQPEQGNCPGLSTDSLHDACNYLLNRTMHGMSLARTLAAVTVGIRDSLNIDNKRPVSSRPGPFRSRNGMFRSYSPVTF